MLPSRAVGDLRAVDFSHSPRRGKGRSLVRTTALITIDNAIDALRGHRVDILTLLALCGPLCVNDIAKRMVLDPSLISHELEILEALGLVTWTRCKQQHIYRVMPIVHSRHKRGRIIITIVVQSGDRLRLNRDASEWLDPLERKSETMNSVQSTGTPSRTTAAFKPIGRAKDETDRSNRCAERDHRGHQPHQGTLPDIHTLAHSGEFDPGSSRRARRTRK